MSDQISLLILRSGLRLLPLAFLPILRASDGNEETGRRYSLAILRSLYVSWACVDTSADDQVAGSALRSAISNLQRNSGYSTGSAADLTAVYVANVAMAASVSIAATEVPESLSSDESSSVSVSESDDLGNRSYDEAKISAQLAAGDETQIEIALEDDMAWTHNQPYPLLLGRPLWPQDVRGDSRYRANFPIWARQPFDEFAQSEHVKSHGWHFWVDWYRRILPNGPTETVMLPVDTLTSYEILEQPAKFWEREPNEVVSDLATIEAGSPTKPVIIPEPKGVDGEANSRQPKSEPTGRPTEPPESLALPKRILVERLEVIRNASELRDAARQISSEIRQSGTNSPEQLDIADDLESFGGLLDTFCQQLERDVTSSEAEDMGEFLGQKFLDLLMKWQEHPSGSLLIRSALTLIVSGAFALFGIATPVNLAIGLTATGVFNKKMISEVRSLIGKPQE